MTRATGGSAWEATSTRSSPLSKAYCIASFVGLIPSCEPSSSINLTCEARMYSLIRVCGAGLEGGSTVRLGLKGLSPNYVRSFLLKLRPSQTELWHGIENNEAAARGGSKSSSLRLG